MSNARLLPIGCVESNSSVFDSYAFKMHHICTTRSLPRYRMRAAWAHDTFTTQRFHRRISSVSDDTYRWNATLNTHSLVSRCTEASGSTCQQLAVSVPLTRVHVLTSNANESSTWEQQTTITKYVCWRSKNMTSLLVKLMPFQRMDRDTSMR